MVIGLEAVRSRLESASVRCGRTKPLRLIAVTKNVAVADILRAVELGVTDIGENRVQEAESKFQAIGRRVRWHLIGHLQTNKARRAAELFDVIHTVDSVQLAGRLSQARLAAGRQPLEVLVQVNIDDDGAKHGVAPSEAAELAREIGKLQGLRLVGLMTIGRLVAEPEEARATFSALARLAKDIDRLDLPGVSMDELSMGMSADFDIAVEEGSTMVRVGSAIFGGR